jgi:hypothetical protein
MIAEAMHAVAGIDPRRVGAAGVATQRAVAAGATRGVVVGKTLLQQHASYSPLSPPLDGDGYSAHFLTEVFTSRMPLVSTPARLKRTFVWPTAFLSGVPPP